MSPWLPACSSGGDHTVDPHLSRACAGFSRLRDAGREAGQELVEFALVLPLLLLLTLGIIEFGRAIWAYNTIANAAREGARYGIVAPTDPAGIDAATRELIVGLACDPLDIPPAQVTAITVTQTVSCRFKTVVGNFIPALADVLLSSTATMQREQ